MNMDTRGGMLAPAGAPMLLPPAISADPIETLAYLHRRWHNGPDKDLLIAAAAGQLYCMPVGGSAFTKLNLPAGWPAGQYAQSVWSWVAYEINLDGAPNPVDVLFLSNATDGMIYIRSDNMTVLPVHTPKKFNVIARYAERIWGGGIPDDPDMLVYSAPFDPLNWEANTDIPSDGAGDVMQPSWDGDSFHALSQLGSQLIAFKRNRIWRVMNTDPAEYVFKEQYGGGTPYFQTIAVSGERIFMLGDEGMMVYDGLSAAYFQTEYCQDIFAGMNKAVLHKACACVWKDTYYCALPMGEEMHNSIVLMYDFRDQTWLAWNAVSVEAFLSTNDALYYTSSTAPGRIYKWNRDAWQSGSAAGQAVWVGQWQDFQQKTIRKSRFEVFLTAEAQANTSITLSIETENGLKSKTLEVIPADAGKAKQRCVRLGGEGRRFRLSVSSNGTVPWRIAGGIQLRAETDAD